MRALSLRMPSSVLSRPGTGAMLLAVFVSVGLFVVWMPLALLIPLVVIWIGLRGRHFPVDVLVVLIAGSVILNYGFANLACRVACPFR